MTSHQAANRHYIDGGVQLLEVARLAASSYRTAETSRKQEMLRHVLAGATWKEDGLELQFRLPFHALAAATRDRQALMRSQPGWSSRGGELVRIRPKNRVRTVQISEGSNSSSDSDLYSDSTVSVPAGTRNEIWLGRKDSNL